MSVWETVLYLVLPSVGLYLLIALFVWARRIGRRTHYQLGEPWTYPPILWTASPQGAHHPDADPQATTTGERGGARGDW